MTTPPPDALAEMGRDLAQSMQGHPERYLQTLHGIPVLVIDDAGYEALFYLFSGYTVDNFPRKDVNGRPPTVLFMGSFPVLSNTLLEEARAS